MADSNKDRGTVTGTQQGATQQSENPPVPKVAEEQVLARATAIDKQLHKDAEEVEHVGEAGKGAEEVGKDTGIEPGKNVGLQAISKEAHEKALAELDESRTVQKNSRKRLTMEDLQKMNQHEIRAVATDRGYEVKPGGWKSASRAFLAEQEKDKTLEAPEKK